MNPEDIVLVALVNHPRDWELIQRERWYRIPTRHAPKQFSGAQYLAFYFNRTFGEQKWQVAFYAAVRGHELARRRDLLPEEPLHPRADALYYKLQLGEIQRREPPIFSKRGRRVLFLWSTWEKFSGAHEWNDLFHQSAAHDKLWEAFKRADLDVEREIVVREGRSRYRVDFLIYCARGRVAISIGPAQVGVPSTKDFRALALPEAELENHFERAVKRIRARVRELGGTYPMAQEKVG